MSTAKLSIIITIFFSALIPALAQDIYIYPSKKLADDSRLEYRRYTLDEARAYDRGTPLKRQRRGGSFDNYLPLDWGQERRLTEQENVYRARVVTSGDSIYCTYSLIGGRQVHYIRSLDSGVSWEPYQTLDDSVQDFSYDNPEILRNGARLMIGAGMQDAPYGKNFGYFRSSDYGGTWGELSKIFPNESNNRLHYSSFANWGQLVYASYISVHDYDSIYVIKSTNWGDTWNGRGVNVAYLNGTLQPMTVRASGNDVHLVWVNEESPISCRYSRSTDSGQTWSEEIDIAQDEDGAQRVFVAVQDTHVVVSWNGFKYSPYGFTGDLFIKQSFDSGETWGEEQVLTDLHKVWMGSVYIEDSLIVATWQDLRFEDGNNEVMAKFSTDYGQTWTEEERLSFAQYDSHAPISCATEDRIHVFWGDMRLSAPGLYYCVNDPMTDIEINETSPPTNIYISSYPNPFNARTMITYNDIEGGDICIYDITGRLIRTFRAESSDGQLTWAADDDAGHEVSSGVYFIRARSSHGSASAKVVYLR